MINVGPIIIVTVIVYVTLVMTFIYKKKGRKK